MNIRAADFLFCTLYLKSSNFHLFPADDILTKLQQHWKGYADALRQEDREAFFTMIEKCYAHATAINAEGEPSPNEAMLMSLLFSQYKMINWWCQSLLN